MLHPFLGPPALLLLVAAIAVGGAPLERALDRAPRAGAALALAPTVERWLVRFALGSVSWMVLLFVLASLRLLRPPVVVPSLAVLALVGAFVLVRATPAVRRADRAPALPPPTADGSAGPRSELTLEQLAVLVLGAALAVVLAGLWLHALRPDVATDADVYHLTLPRLYLEHGGFYRVPWSVYSNWPLGLELMFAAAMAAADRVLASQLHFAFGVLALAVAGLLAATDLPPAVPRRGAPAAAALLAATLVLLNPVVLFEIRVAYVDLAQAFFLALGALLVERLRSGVLPARQGLLLVGLCCGAMASLKPNGLLGAVPLVAMVLYDQGRERRASAPVLPGALASVLLLGIPAAVLALPWVAKSWLLTGNPVYPFLHDLFGGPGWNAVLSERFGRWQRSIGMGREPLDYLLLPIRVALDGDFGYARFDGRLHAAWIVLVPAAAIGAWRDARARRLLAMAGIFFVLWAATAQQMRFLIPVLPLLAAAAARGITRALWMLPARLRSVRGALAAVGAVALAFLLVRSAAVYLEQTPRLVRDYVTHGAQLHEKVRHPVYRWIDEELPANAKLLLLRTNRGFFVEREYLADSFFEASQIGAVFGPVDSPAAARLRLLELGVSHVLVDAGGPQVPYPRSLAELMQDPRHLRRVYSSQDGRFVVFEIDAPGF
ncbi:MAG TPA: hypothetical protein VNB06_21370 [Thermoanaerobaculia bacterium]|nr:hypothetical protein [Thermoanaerobaculia bacterium]